MVRLADCCAGRGIDEASLRASMAVVSQRVHIFSATLSDNLRLAKPQASDEELLAVLHKVGLQGLVTEPAAGLAQWLGDGGRPLSGGEQRRLGLARVLLHDGPLLLLDEATEGLDPATEQAMLALIFAHAKGKSLLMITHRLSGLEQLDRIAKQGHDARPHHGYRAILGRSARPVCASSS